MKVYLASFMEPENFGPGRLIAVTSGSKPIDLDVELKFMHLAPPESLVSAYHKKRLVNKEEAVKYFKDTFQKQLDSFKEKVLTNAREKNVKPMDILPFKEGDTLASWERKRFSHYRGQIQKILVELGYEVVLN